MNKITEDLSGWENGSYYVGNTEGATIQYNTIFYASDNPKAENLHIYGLTGSPEIRDDEVTLTANNFSGNSISVTNNDDDYEFILSGDFGGKTFTGSVGNDDITNLAGANNSIDGDAGDYTIRNGLASNVTLNGDYGNDTIQIGTFNNVTDFTVENFGASDVIQFIHYEDNPTLTIPSNLKLSFLSTVSRRLMANSSRLRATIPLQSAA